MRLVVFSFVGKNILLDVACSSVVDVARCLLDFLSDKLSSCYDAEFIKFSVSLKREVKDGVIAFDFTPQIIDFN